jgi:diguanylate cyclase (GGDEF)-like protein/hemerythrin-like metal-binding protein/PAS domain S-box-containing protein
MQPMPTESQTDIGQLAALLINSNLIALALADHDRLLFVNTAFSRLFGRTGDLADVSILDLVQPVHREHVRAALAARIGPPRSCVAEALRDDGLAFDVELRFEPMTHDNAPLMAIFAQDVTDRSRAEEKLNLLAYSDPLTGLGNRALFADHLRQAMLTARRATQSFALLMLDLDGFKSINDRHGHDAGDRVLQRIAARLLATLRETDSIARIGGDEFAVLLPMLKARGDAMTVADRLVDLARQPISLGQFQVKVGASVGIAVYPEHANTVDHLLAAADSALYEAKRRGRDRAAWATTASVADTAPAQLMWSVAHEVGVREIDEQHAWLVSLLNDLAAALRNGEPHDAALKEVIRYTGFHFATEERLMRGSSYHGAAAHRDMHRRLLEDLRGLRLDGAKVSVSLIVRYLQEWLLRHVDGADRDLAAALTGADVE